MRVESLHLHVDHVPRFQGSGKSRKRCSSAQTHDYICRQGKYTPERLARARKKSEQEEGLVAAGHLYMPSWGLSKTGSSRPFWMAADEYERVDARLATTIEASIARDIYAAGLSEELIERFATRQLKGHPLTWAIHNTIASDQGPQPHTHMEITERLPVAGRVYTPQKFFGRTKEGALKDRRMNDKGFVRDCRRTWADISNELLEQIGSDVRVTEESYETRGIQRLPGVHLGPTLAARVARAERLAAAGQLREQDIVEPSPALIRSGLKRKKLAPIEKELFELHNQEKEQDMRIDSVNEEFAVTPQPDQQADQLAEEIHMQVLDDDEQAVLAREDVLARAADYRRRQRRAQRAATTEQAEESIAQEIRMRIITDHERQRVLTEAEVNDIKRDIRKALVGWAIKWKATEPGEMPAFVARSGAHKIDFDGHEITGHDSSEETLQRMVAVAKAAGKRRVEISGSPQACRRLAELCVAAGIEVVQPTAKKVAAPKPISVEKSAAPASKPFDLGPTPSPFKF